MMFVIFNVLFFFDLYTFFLREVIGAAVAMGLTILTNPSTIAKSVAEFLRMDMCLLT